MMTEELLLKNGFKRFDIPAFSNADRFYQKEITDKKFLDVYYYDKFKDNGALDYDFEFEIVEERDNCWCKKLIYGIDKNMTLEDIQEELNK